MATLKNSNAPTDILCRPTPKSRLKNVEIIESVQVIILLNCHNIEN